jgi:hypothetical protein
VSKRLRESTAGAASVSALLRGAIAAHEQRARKAKVTRKAEAAQRPILPGARVLEAATAAKGAGAVVKIVLIDEGLGNRRNMNYYGPEAIESAVAMFEGKPCFLDHPSETEESDLPERTVRRQVGFYKNLRVEKLKQPQTGLMVDACVGELHFDQSVAGREAYAKALTALHYQQAFPGSPLQYVGWSVLGDGKAETRTMEVDGEDVEVHYVTEFTEGDSCDMVTRAGRGGRALVAISENDQGAQEDGMKKLKATLAKLQESAKKATGEAKDALDTAIKLLKTDIQAIEADAAAEEGAMDVEAVCAKREGESDEDHKGRMHKLAKHLSGLLGAKQEGAGDEDDDADAAADKPAPKAQEADREARVYAVKAYIAEAGVDEDVYDEAELAALAKMPFREAKRAIDKDARLVESATKSFSRRVPVALLRAGNREGAETDTKGRGNATLKESFRKED